VREFQAFCALAGAALIVCAASSAGSGGGASSVLLQPDGKIVVVGWGQRGGQTTFGLARYLTDGRMDTRFGFRGKAVTPQGQSSEAYAAARQPDGKVVAAGYSAKGTFANTWRFRLARYTAGGALDSTFGEGGRVTTSFGSDGAEARAVALQADGKIVAAGDEVGDQVFVLARYTKSGKLDPGFGEQGRVVTFEGPNARVNGLAVQPDGKILAAGTVDDSAVVARYRPDGSRDFTFGGGTVVTSFGGPSQAYAVGLEPNGKIVIAGAVGTGDATNPGWKFALARYLADGSLDPSFGSGGIVTTPIGNVTGADLPYGGVAFALGIQPDGKIMAGGTQLVPWPGRGGFALVRYDSDGTLDSSFGAAGVVTTSFGYSPPENPTEDGDEAWALALQPDGKIVAGGESQFGPHTEQYAVALARYRADGSLDQSFGTGGLVKTSLALCVVPKLRGQKMDWFAQQRIKGSHCAVGKIKRVHSRHVKRRRIISEKPRPGTVHVEGTKVRLVVSKGRR
jgi:uncharacterized delta-60 repeat protein